MVIFVIVIVLLYLFCFLTGKDGFKEIILALLTWPVLISVFLSWLVMLFKEQIRNILKRIKKVDAGTFSVSVQEEKDNEEEKEKFNEVIRKNNEIWARVLENERNSAISALNILQEVSHDTLNRVIYEKMFWQFKYADLFLVYKTKCILIALNACIPKVSDISAEHEASISALKDCEFIIEEDGYYKITQIGRIFIDYLESVGFKIV